jgi:uncharacterized protein (DUF2267 family)
VVLGPNTSAFEAARALENNEIGSVIVQDRGAVVGIVTDRDLTTRVVAPALDPKTTTLAAVMTSPVATLSPHDEQRSAVRLMQDRGVRRIPLVDGGRLVGIVTLDDLLLDEAAPLDQLAAVVQTQVVGGRSDASRVRSRCSGRAEATYGRFVRRLCTDAGLPTLEEAETALHVVLRSLVRRLTPDEAKDLIAQLPSLLQAGLLALPPGPDKLVTRGTIETELARRLDVDAARAGRVLASVGASIADSVSAGQMADVRGQLPDDLRGVFELGARDPDADALVPA